MLEGAVLEEQLRPDRREPGRRLDSRSSSRSSGSSQPRAVGTTSELTRARVGALATAAPALQALA